MLRTLCLGYLLCFFVLLMACKEDEPPKQDRFSFQPDGLSGMIINELSLTTRYLVAATNDGIYVKVIDGGGEWTLNGLDNKNIRTFVALSDNQWIVAEKTATDHNLYHTFNAGNSWELLQSNFGGGFEQGINDLEYIPETEKLYATGTGVVAESSDQGVTWTPIIGDWDLIASGLDFVENDPDKNVLWSGGQNAIEEFILYQYNIQTAEETFYRGLVSSPSVAKSILFDPMDPDHVMIGAEGGIISSSDYGENWTLVKDDHDDSRFTFGLVRDLENSETVYAGGWLKDFDNPQQLVLSVSDNNGATWEDVIYQDDDLFGGVYDIVSLMEKGNQTLYLGLYKGGIFKVTINE